MKSAEQWSKEIREREFSEVGHIREIQLDARAELLAALDNANKIIGQQADENTRTAFNAWRQGMGDAAEVANKSEHVMHEHGCLTTMAKIRYAIIHARDAKKTP